MIEEQILEKLNPRPYKDRLRLTYGFGIPTGYIAEGGHQGIDVGETNRLAGDNLYAPFDGTVYKAREWLGSDIGWAFYMESTPTIINRKKTTVRLGYLHTRGKSTLKDGESVYRGDVVDKSGGIFNWNIFWKGQHTHISIMPRYDDGNPKQIFWQPEWFNGHNGFVDPLKCIDPVNPEVEMVYFYYLENKLKFYGFGANKRMKGILKMLGLTKYTSHQMLGMIYDYTRLIK